MVPSGMVDVELGGLDEEVVVVESRDVQGRWAKCR